MTEKRFGITSELPNGWVDIIDTDDDRTLCNIRIEYANNMIKLLNELHDENHIKLEIVDAFILGMEDEKEIAPKDKEFQCKINHTIRVLKKLKEDMLNPTEFKRLKELKE